MKSNRVILALSTILKVYLAGHDGIVLVASKRRAVAFDHPTVEQRAVLQGPGLGGVVDVNQSKSLRVAEGPFKVIQ